LLILTIASFAFSIHHPTSFWSVILFLNYLIFFYLIVNVIGLRRNLKQLVFLVMGIAIFLSLLGFLKLLGLNPLSFWTYAVQEVEAHRLASTYVNPDHFAGYLEMLIPLIVGLLITGYLDDKLFPAIFFALILALSFIMTFSRGGWISLAFGIIFLGICLAFDKNVNKKRLIGVFGICFILTMIFILVSPSLTERLLTLFQVEYITNLRDRMITWKGIYQVISDHPFIGTGPGTFSIIFFQYQPSGTGGAYYYTAHNDYLHFISEIGIFFIPIFFWLTIALFKSGFKKMKNPSRLVRGITAGSMAGIVSIMVHSIVDFNLHIPSNAILFTLLSAFVASPVPKSHSETIQAFPNT
jgi:O-antigen ligase